MSATYGPTFGTPLARYDPTSSSWKTSQTISLLDLETSSVIFPKWGITHDGVLSALPTQVHRTNESDFSLLPTPRASSAVDDILDTTRKMMRNREGNGYKSRLEEAVALISDASREL